MERCSRFLDEKLDKTVMMRKTNELPKVGLIRTLVSAYITREHSPQY